MCVNPGLTGLRHQTFRPALPTSVCALGRFRSIRLATTLLLSTFASPVGQGRPKKQFFLVPSPFFPGILLLKKPSKSQKQKGWYLKRTMVEKSGESYQWFVHDWKKGK